VGHDPGRRLSHVLSESIRDNCNALGDLQRGLGDVRQAFL
jgi:hypothetical protein